MDKLKKMTDAELIRFLREYNIPHGPIVESTRKLYEKKLYEHERTKKSSYPSTQSSYESKQQSSTRDTNTGSLISVGETAFGIHLNLQDQMKSPQELSGTSCLQIMGAKETKQGAGGKRQKMGAKDLPKEVVETKQNMGTRVTRQKKTVVETKQETGAGEIRQKMTVVETMKEGVRVTRQKKDVGETSQLVADPASDLSATATIVEVTQEPEIKLSSPSTTRQILPKYTRPSIHKRHKPALTGALEMEKQPERNQSYHLAMSLVPLLAKVPEEKVVDLRHDLLNVISSYSTDTPPNLPHPASARHK